jgi:uncharacterized protein (TIGR02118 family)
MIKVTFLYRTSEGSFFDLDYYLSDHLRLSKEVFGDVLRGITIDRGISGIEPGTQAPFHVMAHLLFDSLEDFYVALMPRIDELKEDAAKYTDAETLIQISSAIVSDR